MRTFILAGAALVLLVSGLFALLQALPDPNRDLLILRQTWPEDAAKKLLPNRISLKERLELPEAPLAQYAAIWRKVLSGSWGFAQESLGLPVQLVLREYLQRTGVLFMLSFLLAVLLGAILTHYILQSTSTSAQRFHVHIQIGLVVGYALFIPAIIGLLRWFFSSQLDLLPPGGLLNPILWRDTTAKPGVLLLQILGAALTSVLAGTLTYRIVHASGAPLRWAATAGAALASSGLWGLAWVDQLKLVLDLLAHLALPLVALTLPLTSAYVLVLKVGLYGRPSGSSGLLMTYLVALGLTLTLLVEAFSDWPGLSAPLRLAFARRDFPLLVGIFATLAAGAIVFAGLLSCLQQLWEKIRSATSDQPQEAPIAPAHTPTNMVAPRLFAFGIILVVLVTVVSFGQPLFVEIWNQVDPLSGTRVYDPLVGYDSRLDHPAPPSAQHLLGTDVVGRDGLSWFLWGLRQGLIWAGLAACIACLLGIGLAELGRWRRPLKLINEALGQAALALPLLPLTLLLKSVFPLFGLDRLAWSIGLTSWPLVLSLWQSRSEGSRLTASLGTLALMTGQALLMILTFSFLGLRQSALDLGWYLMPHESLLLDPFQWWWLSLVPAAFVSLLAFVLLWIGYERAVA